MQILLIPFCGASIWGFLHLAAESHVDRSITDPLAFVKTNVIGTMNLLNAAKTIWKMI
jgi:dTDP-glucose 4,6-dehydratase